MKDHIVGRLTRVPVDIIHVPPKTFHQAHMKCIVDQYDTKGKRFDSADDAPDTSYYQWVVFVFAFQVSLLSFTTKKGRYRMTVRFGKLSNAWYCAIKCDIPWYCFPEC